MLLLVVSQGCSLLRSKSFCQADIEKLLDGQDSTGELIGDFTKVRPHRGALGRPLLASRCP